MNMSDKRQIRLGVLQECVSSLTDFSYMLSLSIYREFEFDHQHNMKTTIYDRA